jgi:hypothetical protein
MIFILRDYLWSKFHLESVVIGCIFVVVIATKYGKINVHSFGFAGL